MRSNLDFGSDSCVVSGAAVTLGRAHRMQALTVSRLGWKRTISARSLGVAVS